MHLLYLEIKCFSIYANNTMKIFKSDDCSAQSMFEPILTKQKYQTFINMRNKKMKTADKTTKQSDTRGTAVNLPDDRLALVIQDKVYSITH